MMGLFYSAKYTSAVLIMALCMTGCHTDEINNKDFYMQTTTIRILSLGDSYTIGESVAFKERWPVILESMLKDSGFNTAPVEIIARTGWTTFELMEGIKYASPVGPYDLVTLLIGVNNQYRGLNTLEYRLQFRQLLDTAISFAGGDQNRILVVSIPDYSVTPFAAQMDQDKVAREIDIFNAINRDETEKTLAAYINITPISREASEDSVLIADDGLHPSGKMYSRWVELIYPEAERILKHMQ